MEVCLFLELCILGFTYIKLFKTFNSPRLHPPMSLSFMLKISNVLRDTNLPNPLGKIKQPPKRIRYIKLISLPIPYGDSMYSKILSQVIFKKYNLHILQMVLGNLPQQSTRLRYLKCIKLSIVFESSTKFFNVNARNHLKF